MDKDLDRDIRYSYCADRRRERKTLHKLLNSIFHPFLPLCQMMRNDENCSFSIRIVTCIIDGEFMPVSLFPLCQHFWCLRTTHIIHYEKFTPSRDHQVGQDYLKDTQFSVHLSSHTVRSIVIQKAFRQ